MFIFQPLLGTLEFIDSGMSEPKEILDTIPSNFHTLSREAIYSKTTELVSEKSEIKHQIVQL